MAVISIWKSTPDLSALNQLLSSTMVSHLGIKFIEIGNNYIKATMPVDQRTCQPEGLLHGGASTALAETLGSVGSYLCIDPLKNQCVGLEINASHLRTVREDYVTGIAKPLRLGKSAHVWEIRIFDPNQRLACISRITIAVLNRS